MSRVKQEGSGFFQDLFGGPAARSEDRYSRGESSYDSETGYHLTAEQKRLRAQENRRQIRYTQAVQSEDALINSYETLAKSSRNYYKAYNRHLGNLITLDDNLNMSGLQQTFKSQVIKNVFKGNDVIDRTNPLLLRNFLVSDATLPRNFRKEHLISQVRYILRKFNPKDELLIQSIDVTLEGNKANIKLRGLNGDLYERTASIDEDFNLDISDLKRNMKEVLMSVKRKMDFEIEIVSDFELGSDDLEIPGLNFLEDDSALAKRMKDLEMKKSLRADGPIPLSQMSAKSTKKKSMLAPKKDIIFGISEPKPKKLKSIELDVGAPQIPGDQGFGEQRALEKKPLAVEESLAKIFEGGPAALFAPPVPVAAPGAPAAPAGFAGAVVPNALPVAPVAPVAEIDTRDELEKKCNALTSQGEAACKGTLGCFYNKTLNPPKCHKNKKI
jgi:hypothetical protein